MYIYIYIWNHTSNTFIIHDMHHDLHTLTYIDIHTHFLFRTLSTFGVPPLAGLEIRILEGRPEVKKGGEIHDISTMSVLKVWLRIAELYGMVSFFFYKSDISFGEVFCLFVVGGGLGVTL